MKRFRLILTAALSLGLLATLLVMGPTRAATTGFTGNVTVESAQVNLGAGYSYILHQTASYHFDGNVIADAAPDSWKQAVSWQASYDLAVNYDSCEAGVSYHETGSGSGTTPVTADSPEAEQSAGVVAFGGGPTLEPPGTRYLVTVKDRVGTFPVTATYACDFPSTTSEQFPEHGSSNVNATGSR
jgi:hypothetical protein